MFGIISGIAGRRSAKKQARRAKQIGEYNAKVAELNAKVQKDALVQESRQLVKMQREEKALDRMSVAGRGGLATGGDLRMMISKAQQMQLDLLELETQQDLAIHRGKIEAQQARMGAAAQASNLKAQGRMSLIKGAASTFTSFLK